MPLRKVGNKMKKFSLTAIVLMSFFSLSSIINLLFGVNLTSITLIIGIVTFFIIRKKEKEEGNIDALEIKRIPQAFKQKSMWLIILLPVFMNVICYIVAEFALPEFIEHLKNRTGMLSIDQLLLLVLELAIAALGEEIAWRGFFQKQLNKAIPFVPTLVISSFLFSICHLSVGNVIVVIYDILFIFINAIIYGIIFHKTENAWVSWIAHFLANLFGTILFLLL